MKEGRLGQNQPLIKPKPKLKMMTLDGEQHSNKNININISYNLTEKGSRPAGSSNELDWSGSGENSPSSNGRRYCFGRRINPNDVLITENANRSPNTTARKNSCKAPTANPQDIVSNECEISIRVVNKHQRQRKQAALGKGRKLENTINIEVKEQRHNLGPYSNPCSPNKHPPQSQKYYTVRKPVKSKKTAERKLTEKMGVPTEKTQAYAKTEQEYLKLRTVNSKELSNQQPSFLKKPLLSPHPIMKYSNNRYSLRPESTKSDSKHSSSKKRTVPAVIDPPQLSRIYKSLLRRIVKVSQLSYSNQSDIDYLEPCTLEDGRKRATYYERMQYAADTIKLYWRYYRKHKVLSFYESVFRKNVRRSDCGLRTKVEPREEFDSQSGVAYSYFVDSEQYEQEVANSIEEKPIEYRGVEKLAIARLEFLKHRQSSSGNIEEEDSQFDINKYHNLYDSRYDGIIESKVEKVEVIDLKSFRYHQIQQWSGVKYLIRRQLQEGHEVNSEELLRQLIQQTEQNKKWIESAGVSRRETPYPLVLLFEKSEYNKSQLARSSNSNYRELVEEKGIADKAFKDSEEVKRRVLYKEYTINKSKRSSRGSSLSDNSMGSQHRRHSSCDEMDTFKEGKESLTSQLLYSQSKQHQSLDQTENRATESINSYLDCGLGQFEFKERLIEPENDSDAPLEPANRPTYSDESMPYRDQLLQQLEEIQPYPIQSPRQDKHSFALEQLWDFVLLEFCQYLHRNEKMERNFKRSFLNVPAQRPTEPRVHRPPGIRCGHLSVREYLTGFIHFILRNSQYAFEVVKNVNFVLGPSSREILFYLRADNDDSDIDFVEEYGYIFAIPLSTFESYELSLPLSSAHESSLETAMMLHHWHRAIFESLNESLDAERPYGIFGKPYLWSQSSRVSRKQITRGQLPLVFRSAVNRMLEMASLPCGIMFDQPECPYYGSHLLPEEKLKVNEDRISLMLADELFENYPNLTSYDDEMTEVLLEMAHYLTDKIFFDTAIYLRKLRRIRSFME